MTPKYSLMWAALALLFSTSAFAADWPAGFSKCSGEGGTCMVGAASREVSFGLKGKWVIKALSGDIVCTSATFGSDPNPGGGEKCALGPLSLSPAPAPTPTPTPTPAPAPTPNAGDATYQSAPASGWAGTNGGTTGGAAAPATAIYKVSSASQLMAAIKAQGDNPKIIKLYGTIDPTSADNGGPYTSIKDQALRLQIKLGSNTTLIGVGSDAKLINANLVIEKKKNVIVRNLNISLPCDQYPKFDENDGPLGNWNSEYDGITIKASTNVWVDHNVFTDAPKTDDQSPIERGKIKQCHDGALDVKEGSDYVTVSNNRFELHEKNNLIGSSDSSSDTDEGHLTVTFNNNHYLNVAERAPRVRFGMVHIYNNYFEGSRSHPVYKHQYSIGVGYKAKIISTNNAFEIVGASKCTDIVKNPGSSSKPGAIVDTGSLVNGADLNVAGVCGQSSAVGWTVPYSYAPLAASAVKASVLSNAGTGKLTVN